jgi:hypothetical protein
MTRHIDHINGIHLLGNPVLPLIPRVDDVGIEIAQEQRFAPSRAL